MSERLVVGEIILPLKARDDLTQGGIARILARLSVIRDAWCPIEFALRRFIGDAMERYRSKFPTSGPASDFTHDQLFKFLSALSWLRHHRHLTSPVERPILPRVATIDAAVMALGSVLS